MICKGAKMGLTIISILIDEYVCEGSQSRLIVHSIFHRLKAIGYETGMKYMEQMMGRLRTAGLILSHRGPKGGYTLNHRLKRITAFDVVRCFYELEDCNKMEVTEHRDSGQRIYRSLIEELKSWVMYIRKEQNE